MNLQIWSWILTVVGVTGFILAGRKIWWCWYVNIGCQALWLIYAIVSHQYGFIVASFVYTIVFTQNAIKWTKDYIDPYRDFDLNKIVMPQTWSHDHTATMKIASMSHEGCWCTKYDAPHIWIWNQCPPSPVRQPKE